MLGRIAGLDVARAIMILLMIQGHTLDALWDVSERHGSGFNLWLSLRGLTAPTFLLLSGLSFTLASRRIWQGGIEWLKVQRRMNRALLLVVLGYSMHLPAKTLSGLMEADSQAWRTYLQVDVLQCIGVGLLLLQVLIWATRTARMFALTSFALGMAIVITTPLLWLKAQKLPFVLAAYMSAGTGSQFPLFPWGGYIFLGASLGCLFRNGFPRLVVPKLALGGLLLIVCGTLFGSQLARLNPAADFWKTSPSLFLVRLGYVLALISMSLLVAPLLQRQGGWIQALAGESLMIYYLHICVLYGSVWNLGLRQYVGASLTLSAAASSAAAMIIGMIALALSWSWLKKTWREQPAWLKPTYWFPS